MNKTVKNLIKLLSGTAITGIVCFAGTVYSKTEAVVTQVPTISASEPSESKTQKTKIVIDDQRDIYYFDPQGLEAGHVYRKQDLAYTPTELIIPKTYNGKSVWLLGRTHVSHFSTDINIPDTQIYYGPFFNCSKLKRVFIPDTITYAYNIFETDQDLPEDRVNKNALDIYVYSDDIQNFFERSYGETIFRTDYSYYDVSYSALIDGEVLEELTVPENITEINESAFFKCKSLKKVTVPNTVTSIGQWAFYSPDLESITICDPNCVIAESAIANHMNGDLKFDGVIYGYKNSTAQKYAKEHGFTFAALDQNNDANYARGDINGDGILSAADVVLLQKWLLVVPDTTLVNCKAADLCEDDKLDVFDLILLKRRILEPDIKMAEGEKSEEKEYFRTVS